MWSLAPAWFSKPVVYVASHLLEMYLSLKMFPILASFSHRFHTHWSNKRSWKWLNRISRLIDDPQKLSPQCPQPFFNTDGSLTQPYLTPPTFTNPHPPTHSLPPICSYKGPHLHHHILQFSLLQDMGIRPIRIKFPFPAQPGKFIRELSGNLSPNYGTQDFYLGLPTFCTFCRLEAKGKINAYKTTPRALAV